MKKHKAGVWYPVSDPPEENIYNIVLCVSGKWADNITYHHEVILDDDNFYEDGRWYIKGYAKENMTVHGWYRGPEYPGITEDEFWKQLGKDEEK